MRALSVSGLGTEIDQKQITGVTPRDSQHPPLPAPSSARGARPTAITLLIDLAGRTDALQVTPGGEIWEHVSLYWRSWRGDVRATGLVYCAPPACAWCPAAARGMAAVNLVSLRRHVRLHGARC